MAKKRDWIFFAVAGAIIAIFLIVTFFKTERIVPYDEAMEYITLTDGETAVTVELNYSKGTIYAYNDGYYGATEGDNIYIVFRRSLFDKWFGKKVPGYASIRINKNGDDVSCYETPLIWYIEDPNDPNVFKAPLNDKIIPAED